ncbi:MAG: J domain-containing protein [Acidimicrobiales bacterium]
MQEAGRNPWEVLGVAEDAPFADVKRAFFLRARATHPDSPGGDAEAFREVQGAYETLMRTARREEQSSGEQRRGEWRQARSRRSTRYTSWVTAATSSRLWVDEDPLAEFFCAARNEGRPDEFASVLAREMGWTYLRVL